MTKQSNFKLISLITYGIWGAICAFFVAMIATGLMTGFLWIFVFGDNPWPIWSGILTQGIIVVLFLSTFSGFLFKGRQKAKILLDMRDHAQAHQKAKNSFLLSLAGLLLFSFLLSYRAGSLRRQNQAHLIQNQEIQALEQSLLKINEIKLFQENNRFKVEVSIPGPTEDQYFLKVEVKSAGYVKGVIEAFDLIIVPEFGEQRYNFEISFKNLGDIYRALAKDYILSFDQKVGVDEIIAVEVTLKLMETDRYTPQQLEKYKLTEDVQIAVANFFFTCLDANCAVTQLKDEEK